MNEINICFSADWSDDVTILNRLLPTIFSIKKYTKNDSKLNFYIITKHLDLLADFKSKLEKLKDQRIDIVLIDGDECVKLINEKQRHFKTFYSYLKLFIPTLFSHLDRIIYLDWDIIVAKEGFEDYYFTDFDDNYIIATEDTSLIQNGEYIYYYPMLFQFKLFKHLTTHYFNSGMMIFNIQKIIADGVDKQMLQFLQKEPPDSQNNETFKYIKEKENIVSPEVFSFVLTDQSVINYIFRDKPIKYIPPIFNNMPRFMDGHHSYENYLREKYGFKDYDDYMDKSIIYHINEPKPWCESVSIRWMNRFQLRAIEKYKKTEEEMDKVLKS